MKCGEGQLSLFLIDSGLKHLCRATIQSLWSKVDDFIFAGHVDILSESLAVALHSFNKEAKPLDVGLLDQDQDPGVWGLLGDPVQLAHRRTSKSLRAFHTFVV